MKYVFKNQDLQMFGCQTKQIWVIFQPLEIVGRGRETQL